MKRLNRSFLPLVLAAGCLFFSGCATVKSFAITSEPNKTVYGQGQDLNLDGLVVIGTYSNNSTQQIRVSASNISGYNKHQPGQQTVTVRSGEGSAVFTVTVKPLLGLTLVRPPAKRLYKQGENLDLDDIVISGIWEGMAGDRITVTRDIVSSYTLGVPGNQEIYVNFENQIVSFSVTVVPLSSIAITRLPSKLAYKQGEDLDISDLIVTGSWEGIGSERVAVSRGNLSGYNSNTIGQQLITVSIYNVSATFTVTVKGLMTITVRTPPNKTVYDYGEALDLTGLVVMGTYSDSSVEQVPINASHISRFDSTKQGSQTVVITVDGRNAIFDVSVRVLYFITVRQPPNKGVYELGEALDLTGITVVGTYTDSSTRVIAQNKLQASGFNSGTPGQQTVIVTVEGKQSSFTVTVLAKRSYDQ
jgi:hypothetical protein